MRLLAIFFSLSILSSCTNAQKTLGSIFNDVKTATGTGESTDVGAGLKQALEIGVSKGADYLSKEDGYLKSAYKILIPAEAKKVTDKLQGIPGFDQVERELTTRLNRAAELAAKEAKPIFVDAIKKMSFRDVTNILMGKNDAATQYLNQTTSTPLYNAFNPVVKKALDEVNATTYWRSVTSAYNKLPFVSPVNTELDDYTTRKALDGLFKKIAEEELNIRTNLAFRTSDLLRKVFAKQDGNRK